MKSTIKMMACLVSILSMSVFSYSLTLSAETFEFKGGSGTVPAHPLAKAGGYFKEIVEARSQGRIKIRWYVGGALGGELAILNQLKDGVIHFATLSNAITGSLNPKMQTMYTPYLILDWDGFFAFTQTEGANLLLDGLKNFGIQGYDWVPYGFNALAYRDPPIKKLEDCKGRKLRAAEAYTIKGTLEALGANAPPIPWNEVYQSIQQRVVEGLTTPPAIIRLGRLDEIIQNVTLADHLFGTHIFWVKDDALEELPGDLRKIFIDAIHEACLKEQKEMRGLDAKSLEEMREKGIKIWTLSPQEKARWIKATRKVLIDHEKRIDDFSGDGRDFLRIIYKSLGRNYDEEIYGQ